MHFLRFAATTGPGNGMACRIPPLVPSNPKDDDDEVPYIRRALARISPQPIRHEPSWSNLERRFALISCIGGLAFCPHCRPDKSEPFQKMCQKLSVLIPPPPPPDRHRTSVERAPVDSRTATTSRHTMRDHPLLRIDSHAPHEKRSCGKQAATLAAVRQDLAARSPHDERCAEPAPHGDTGGDGRGPL